MIPLRDDNPTSSLPLVTITFIVLCTLVFLWQISLGGRGFEAVVLSLGAIPAALFGGKTLPPELALVPPALTVFTSMFLHGSWMHLIGNMLYLWIFGNNVEDAMGHVRFVPKQRGRNRAQAQNGCLETPATERNLPEEDKLAKDNEGDRYQR